MTTSSERQHSRQNRTFFHRIWNALIILHNFLAIYQTFEANSLILSYDKIADLYDKFDCITNREKYTFIVTRLGEFLFLHYLYTFNIKEFNLSIKTTDIDGNDILVERNVYLRL